METKCKHCHNELEWEDTFDTEGGIQEGYLIERQVWTCPNCHKDYIIEQKATFLENDIDIIYFEENEGNKE